MSPNLTRDCIAVERVIVPKYEAMLPISNGKRAETSNKNYKYRLRTKSAQSGNVALFQLNIPVIGILVGIRASFKGVFSPLTTLHTLTIINMSFQLFSQL
jgi:hypothetical protein